jgi:hypothetical protein
MKKLTALILSVLVLLTLFASCSASNYNETGDSAKINDNNYSYGINGSNNEDSEATSADIKESTDDRKIIKNAELGVETKDFDNLIKKLNQSVESIGGYVESSDISGGGYYYASNRSANIIVRIPADKLDSFLAGVRDSGNVTYERIDKNDVTSSYKDIERHIQTLNTEQERLLELLKKANNLSDIMDIEKRLSEIRYELESYETALKSYDDKVDYSTVTLSIDEVERISADENDGFFARVGNGFMNSLYAIGDGLREAAIYFLSAMPFFILLGLIAVVVIVIVKLATKKSRKKAAAKQAQDQPQNDEMK